MVQKKAELHEISQAADDIRIQLTNMEIKSKGAAEEAYKAGIQDIRYLEKMLNKMKLENENEIGFLKKQTSQLTAEKIRLQQHVVGLTSRVDTAEMEICENVPVPKE